MFHNIPAFLLWTGLILVAAAGLAGIAELLDWYYGDADEDW